MDALLELLERNGYDVSPIGTVNRTDTTGVIVRVSRNGGAEMTMVLTETLSVDVGDVHPGVPASLYLAGR